MEKINGELDICVFCLAPKIDEVVLRCKHSFCLECMEDFCRIVLYNRRCPVCRMEISYYTNRFGDPYIVIVDSDSEMESDESQYESD